MLVYQQLLEQALIEQPAGLGVGCEVRPLAVAEQLQSRLELRFQQLVVRRDGRQSSFDGVELPTDTFLFALQQIERYGARIVRLQQPGTFVCQALLLSG